MNKAILYAALALTVLAAPASADGALNGEWRGMMVKGNTQMVPLSLTISDASTELRFGEPYTCRVILQPTGPANGGASYSVKLGTGGFCDQLSGGTAVLTASGGLTVSAHGGKVLVSSQMTKI